MSSTANRHFYPVNFSVDLDSLRPRKLGNSLGVHGYIQSISNVILSAKCQNQMLKVR